MIRRQAECQEDGTRRCSVDKKYYFWIVVGFILIMQIPLFLMAH